MFYINKFTELRTNNEELVHLFRNGSAIFSGPLLKNNVTMKVRELENLVRTLHYEQVAFSEKMEKYFQNKEQSVESRPIPSDGHIHSNLSFNYKLTSNAARISDDSLGTRPKSISVDRTRSADKNKSTEKDISTPTRSKNSG